MVVGCSRAIDPSRLAFAPVQHLSQAGLYTDIATKTVAPVNHAFRPSFELWSDGAVKMRWIALPDGAVIDTTNQDRWVFPVGTRAFKEFKFLGRRVETRLLEKVRDGHGGHAWSVSTFLWRDDE